LAAIWWGRCGILVAVSSGAFLLLSHHFASSGPLADDIVRSGMLVVVGVPVAWLGGAAAQGTREARESERRFRALAESTSDWIWEVDQDGIYTYSSPTVKDLLGYKPEEVIGKAFFDLMPPDEAERVGRFFANIAESAEPFAALENTNIHKDGREVMIETSGVPILDAAGELLGYRGIDRDITERKRAEEALQEAHKRNDAILSTSMDGFYTTHPDGNIFDCNAAFCEMVGYSGDELLGMKITALETVECYEETAQHIQQVIEKGSDRFETAHRRKDGTIIDLEVSVTLVELPEDSFFVCFARDITETKMLWDELSHQLVRDALTGVYNRRYFNETIIQEISRADRYGHHVSFIMGDIDNLKAINDRYGHLVGDQILQGVAEVLQKSVRAADVIIRYGGDEFLVVMPETRTEQAHAALARFQHAFADWLAQRTKDGALPSDLPADVGFSMGVACYQPDTDVAVEEVLAQADAAMYRVKQAKRARRAIA
ncbi:MAG: PAS domain S-box protein, partial [Armatimonadetes bacterium]|nr:PAS domain S-box protein [Armatimonadota bacterium]